MKNLIKISTLLIFILAIMNGCSNSNDMAVQPKAPQQAYELTDEQKQEIQLKADKIVKESLATLKKPALGKSNLREATASEVFATNIVAKFNCDFTLYSYVRNSGLDATGLYIYNGSFCAQPGHMRYGVVYNMSGGGYSTIGSISGPSGGCMSGGITYNINAWYTVDTFIQIVIFDVLMGPPGGSNFVYNYFSNPRHLDCFGPSY